MRRFPEQNDIWTRVGKMINPLNVQNEDVSIIDFVHAMPLNPKFGAMSRRYYSFAEHSVNMYDHLVVLMGASAGIHALLRATTIFSGYNWWF